MAVQDERISLAQATRGFLDSPLGTATNVGAMLLVVVSLVRLGAGFVHVVKWEGSETAKAATVALNKLPIQEQIKRVDRHDASVACQNYANGKEMRIVLPRNGDPERDRIVKLLNNRICHTVAIAR